jgi:hypothetical protein
MHEVLVKVARLALISRIASIKEEQGERLCGDVCESIPDMTDFDSWVEEVSRELLVLTTYPWVGWLDAGVEVYGADGLAWEMWSLITGNGGAKGGGCTQYVREGCMPYLPDLGYLVACCACE